MRIQLKNKNKIKIMKKFMNSSYKIINKMNKLKIFKNNKLYHINLTNYKIK